MQTLNKVSDKLTLVEVERDDDTTNTRYTCNVEVELAGDSIWDCELERVTVTDITVKVVYQSDEDINGSVARVELPANTFPMKGLYLIHVVTGTVNQTEKLLVY